MELKVIDVGPRMSALSFEPSMPDLLTSCIHTICLYFGSFVIISPNDFHINFFFL